jgi:hypothetical protein
MSTTLDELRQMNVIDPAFRAVSLMSDFVDSLTMRTIIGGREISDA